MDGTGAPPVAADVAVAGGRILEVDPTIELTAAETTQRLDAWWAQRSGAEG